MAGPSPEAAVLAAPGPVPPAGPRLRRPRGPRQYADVRPASAGRPGPRPPGRSRRHGSSGSPGQSANHRARRRPHRHALPARLVPHGRHGAVILRHSP
ncbi:hypothetical protein ACFFX0_23570 [Citricoccus parietis]|uniref:Uncharacterized protein n=1 Tax=Citricoccus parietis TaxID=592307 RepID=A0ABV5G4Z3_9MICC